MSLTEENVWKDKAVVRPRLTGDELWILYCLVDREYWFMRRKGVTIYKPIEIKRLRRKLLKLLNSVRLPNQQISIRQRVGV